MRKPYQSPGWTKNLSYYTVPRSVSGPQVTVKAEAAAHVKNQVQKVKDRAQTIVDSIATDKAAAEEKLEAARPALADAENALNTIRPADISTVRKLGKPPHLIMRIMDCCLLLFQRRVDTVQADPDRDCVRPSWGESLKVSGNVAESQIVVDWSLFGGCLLAVRSSAVSVMQIIVGWSLFRGCLKVSGKIACGKRRADNCRLIFIWRLPQGQLAEEVSQII